MVGDPRFMSKEDMDARFALVVGTCLSASCVMAGNLPGFSFLVDR